MSRQFRYRVAALVLGGLLLGGPVLAGGTASADQVDAPEPEGAHQVTFGGDSVFGLSCHSRPDIESMTVPAETRIRVLNQTGHDANLRLGSDTKGMLPDNGTTEVIFRRGTTSMSLTPTCALGNDGSSVLVTAQPSTPAATPDPIPDPSAGDSSTFAGSTDDSGSPSDSTFPDTLSAPVHKPRVRTSKPRHSASSSPAAQAARATARGDGGLRPKIKVKSSSGTPGTAAPAFSGMPPGTAKSLVPDVPSKELNPPVAAPAAAAAPTTEIAAAEPVAAMEPIRERGPIGLLATIAMVCALGVGIAAIRAFVSQRAIRSKIA